jgi:very-short-patch-repair endonuclease
LRKLGWSVLRFWSHVDASEVAGQIAKAMDKPYPTTIS